MWMCAVCLLVTGAVSVVHGAVDADVVTDLPGLAYSPTFKQYSGYLDAGGEKKFHYWFVESQNDPTADPLVLWLNGGPGCSSMDGFLQEHGPFRVSPDGDALAENNYSWNKVANMLYLESPAGVGFSYSPDENYATTDDETSLANYHALKDFLRGFPEFASNDFYIAGESYGGVYVPTLSVRVMEDNDFNFKGFAVGNGVSNWQLNLKTWVFSAYYHGVIGEDLFRRLMGDCCTEVGDLEVECRFFSILLGTVNDTQCAFTYNEFWEAVSQINQYNLFAECQAEEPPAADHAMPCINSTGITNYMNDEDVRQALHITKHVERWWLCTSYEYTWQHYDVSNLYMEVLKGCAKPCRILVYNGDADLVINVAGNEQFVNALNLPIVKARQPWYYNSTVDGSKQVAGYIQQYENLSFVTIRGGAHSVPNNKPLQALAMFKSFLDGDI